MKATILVKNAIFDLLLMSAVNIVFDFFFFYIIFLFRRLIKILSYYKSLLLISSLQGYQ